MAAFTRRPQGISARLRDRKRHAGSRQTALLSHCRLTDERLGAELDIAEATSSVRRGGAPAGAVFDVDELHGA
jgi:hypothetical protein